jgi:nitroimidazol reductase NimA-like FMN-containing flavoprotein (pyridoxamine 5'-phosphate oxidase superfamily)
LTRAARGLADVARAIIESNLYMTLGTADDAGGPWVSPVYYAPAGYGKFFWVSSPEAKHSLNLAGRPEVSIVIFDSGASIGTGQAVYMSAVAEAVDGADRDRGIDIFSRRSQAHGAPAWRSEDVRPPALLRLYRALASRHYVLDPAGDPVHGRAREHRTPVSL